MAFEDLMRDRVDLLKADGREFNGLRASVQDTKVFMPAADLPVDRGDLVRWHKSSGERETFEVVEPGFREAQGPLPANYQMLVRQMGAHEAASAVQHIRHRVADANAPVDQGTIDEGSGPSGVDSAMLKLIDQLRRELANLDLPAAERAAAADLIDGVQAEIEGERPRKAVVSALLAALPAAGNLAGIASIFSDLLAQREPDA